MDRRTDERPICYITDLILCEVFQTIAAPFPVDGLNLGFRLEPPAYRRALLGAIQQTLLPLLQFGLSLSHRETAPLVKQADAVIGEIRNCRDDSSDVIPGHDQPPYSPLLPPHCSRRQKSRIS